MRITSPTRDVHLSHGERRFAFRVPRWRVFVRAFVRSRVRRYAFVSPSRSRVPRWRVRHKRLRACLLRSTVQRITLLPATTCGSALHGSGPSNELADSAEHADSPPRKPKTRLAECPMRHSPDATTRLFTDTHLSSQQFIVPAAAGQEPSNPRARNAAANHRTRERANGRTNTAV
jgi:hypothetical protein